MGSVGCYSERLKMKSTKLTLFEDLLQDPETRNCDSGSGLDDQRYEGDSCPSDCESGISGPGNEQQNRVSDVGMVRIPEGEMIYETIKKKLESGLSLYGFNGEVEAVHRNDYSDVMRRAKLQSFCIYSKAMEMKCGGNANVKYAWFGASKSEISKILSHGFGQEAVLSPVDHPALSLQLAVPDEDGLIHTLLCRVILGKMEEVRPGTGQYNPSCGEFDSGVDDLVSPNKYIVWSSRMNSHIMPEFLVSFRASPSCRGCQRSSKPPRPVPNSDWMPFASLIAVLSRFLPRDAVELISKHHNDYKKQKLTRHEMIQRVRHIAGDKLLMAIIKSYKMKGSRTSSLQPLKRR